MLSYLWAGQSSFLLQQSGAEVLTCGSSPVVPQLLGDWAQALWVEWAWPLLNVILMTAYLSARVLGKGILLLPRRKFFCHRFSPLSLASVLHVYHPHFIHLVSIIFCCYCLLSYLIAVSSRLFLPYPFIFTFVSPILISIPEQEGVGEASEQCFVWENLFWGTELGSTPLKSWERQRNDASFDFSKWESLELMEVLCQQPPGSLWPLQMEWRCTIAFITNSRARPSWCIPAVKF